MWTTEKTKIMKIIKSLLIVCIAIALQLSASASSPFMKRLKPSGDVVTETFDIPSSSYDEVDVSSLANVRIVEGSGDIVVKIDSNLASKLVVEVSKGELKIDLDGASSRSGEFTFDVVVPYDGKLKRISTSGVSSVTSEVVLTGDQVSLRSSGLSNITAIIDAEESNVRSSGSSGIDVKCKSKALWIQSSGSSDIEASIETTRCEVKTSGSSDISVQGETNDVRLTASGSSGIRAKDLKYKTVVVSRSGSADVRYRKK